MNKNTRETKLCKKLEIFRIFKIFGGHIGSETYNFVNSTSNSYSTPPKFDLVSHISKIRPVIIPYVHTQAVNEIPVIFANLKISLSIS